MQNSKQGRDENASESYGLRTSELSPMPKPSWLLKEFSINDFGRIAEARVEHTLTSQE